MLVNQFRDLRCRNTSKTTLTLSTTLRKARNCEKVRQALLPVVVSLLLACPMHRKFQTLLPHYINCSKYCQRRIPDSQLRRLRLTQVVHPSDIGGVVEVEKVAVEVGVRYVGKWVGLRRLAMPRSHKQVVKRSLGPHLLTYQIFL